MAWASAQVTAAAAGTITSNPSNPLAPILPE
jgi:hypothetical protein